MSGFMGFPFGCKATVPLTVDLGEHLSANFTVRELTRSQAATRLGISNVPDAEQMVALRAVSTGILQPVRDRFGSTSVSSGLRVPRLNMAIGGSKSSQHCPGEAMDFEALAVGNLELAAWIRDTLDFDQLILEFSTPGDPRSGWVHCSYVSAQTNRHHVLTASKVGRKTVYTVGLG